MFENNAEDSGFIRLLQARGFVASLEAASQNAADAGLVRSVMAAGFYPLVRGGAFPPQGRLRCPPASDAYCSCIYAYLSGMMCAARLCQLPGAFPLMRHCGNLYSIEASLQGLMCCLLSRLLNTRTA
jgi:hypothetical protein